MTLCRAAGLASLYLSNDVDGLDPAFAPGTGTPEPDGLSLDFVLALIERLGKEFELVGGDVMEVAPDLAPTPEGRSLTLATAAECLRVTCKAMLARSA